jgi:hypothetical protein
LSVRPDGSVARVARVAKVMNAASHKHDHAYERWSHRRQVVSLCGMQVALGLAEFGLVGKGTGPYDLVTNSDVEIAG